MAAGGYASEIGGASERYGLLHELAQWSYRVERQSRQGLCESGPRGVLIEALLYRVPRRFGDVSKIATTLFESTPVHVSITADRLYEHCRVAQPLREKHPLLARGRDRIDRIDDDALPRPQYRFDVGLCHEVGGKACRLVGVDARAQN